MKIALIQMMVKSAKAENLKNASLFIQKAADKGAKLICLPECFTSPYGVKHFPNYSEEIPNGETCSFLSEIARKCNVWLIGGSLPEKRDGKLYNSSVVFNSDGVLVGKYSKVHLFDIDVPGKITFKESDVLTGGSRLLSFSVPINDTKEAPVINIGLGICYDIRFPEIAHIYSRHKNCSLLFYPGAFNMTTGPAHWELLARARALDNQCYVALCSIARDVSAEYVGYGYSLVAGPWGDVCSLDEKEGILEFDIDMNEINRVRNSIPLNIQRREDVYSTANEI